MREAGIDVTVQDDITLEELENVIADYEAIVVRSRTKVRAPLIDKATNLKLIIRGGVGLDNIDVDYARSKGIEVRNTPSASSNSVAELTVGYLFALARRIPQATASLKAGKWEKKAFSKGSDLSGKTLGLVGLGRIGRLVARKALALGMSVLYHSRHHKPELEAELGIEYAALDDLLAEADYVSLHCPLSEETRHLIDERALRLMKPTAILVNTSRGAVVDTEALLQALQQGWIAAAALDVTDPEPLPADHPLLELDQVIGTPHVGAGTAEAKARVGEEVAQIAIEFAAR